MTVDIIKTDFQKKKKMTDRLNLLQNFFMSIADYIFN